MSKQIKDIYNPNWRLEYEKKANKNILKIINEEIKKSSNIINNKITLLFKYWDHNKT